MKTGTLKQGALGWMFLLDRRLIVWSAHEFSTAQEAFRDMLELVEGTPELDRKVKAVHRANGDEAIELLNGCRLKFKARTKAAAAASPATWSSSMRRSRCAPLRWVRFCRR